MYNKETKTVSIRKISFIKAGTPGLHIFSKFPIPRLGAVLLSTILREKGYTVKPFIEDLAAPDWSFIESSDIVCISTITSTAIKAYGMGKQQIMILTPLPGTPLFNDMMKSGRLLHTDWSKYDVQHAVFKPRLMSPAALQIETLRAMGRFYSWKYVFRHLARLDFRYTAVGIFAKRAVHKTLKAFSAYRDNSEFNTGQRIAHLPHDCG
jgi:hypothetical protein